MATRRLHVQAGDNEHFFVSVQDGTLVVGTGPEQADIILANLQVLSLCCDVEVDEGAIVVASDPAAEGTELQPGQVLQVGQSSVSLEGEGPAELEEVEPARVAETQTMPALGCVKRLVVVDGADQGRIFALNESGPTSIGKSPKHADIVLHDFYVGRVHCELNVEGDHVVVTHVEGQGTTQVNGKNISSEELRLGDVIRVGNSHLRYELGVGEPPAPRARPEEPVERADSEGAESAPEEEAPPDPLADLLNLRGQVLGHFEIGDTLGRSPSGLVFRAQDRKTGQTVTLKVLAPSFPANDAELQAFVRALKLVSPLRHSHLVTLYAAGKAGHYCWIAREYVEGKSLAEMIDDGKLGWKRACRVALHLGRVLDFLHQHHLVHGSLTPANVLIDAESRTTKLANLMLDRALEGSLLAETIRAASEVDDLPYRAPESLETDAAPDDIASLYSLGVMVYALTTGRPPYEDATVEALLRRIREGKLAKPSKFAREMPAPFETAILKLLAPSPRDRFQSAAELLLAIEPIANMNEIR